MINEARKKDGKNVVREEEKRKPSERRGTKRRGWKERGESEENNWKDIQKKKRGCRVIYEAEEGNVAH